MGHFHDPASKAAPPKASRLIGPSRRRHLWPVTRPSDRAPTPPKKASRLRPDDGSIGGRARRSRQIGGGRCTQPIMGPMAERRFSAAIMIRREPNIVFAWVADHRNVPRVLEGVSRWEPLGGRDRGQGARFKVAMRALGVPL